MCHLQFRWSCSKYAVFAIQKCDPAPFYLFDEVMSSVIEGSHDGLIFHSD